MTTNLPSTKLGAVLAAAKKLPAVTGATQAGAAKHAMRRTAILADISESMDRMSGSKKRIDILQDALDLVQNDMDATLIAFGSTPRQVERSKLPPPHGSTALHLAILFARNLNAQRLLVISDGGPDSEEKALDAARLFGRPIDIIYCGDDSDAAAKNFMDRLAACTGGRSLHQRFSAGAPAIAADMRRLALPQK